MKNLGREVRGADSVKDRNEYMREKIKCEGEEQRIMGEK